MAEPATHASQSGPKSGSIWRSSFGSASIRARSSSESSKSKTSKFSTRRSCELAFGIGETPAERVDTLLVIRDLADRLGHIQEVIVQPFHPKEGTRMQGVPALGDGEVAAWVAAFGNAKLAGRDTVMVQDLPAPGGKRSPIGFVQ